jgi:signal transduction histidine kinase
MRVLIVDDSPLVRRALRDTLAAAFPGAELGEAATGAEGLSLLQARNWEVVLLDLSLPDGGGLPAVNAFRRLRPEVPLVVMSMHPASQYAPAVEAAGAAYLAKGTDPDAIVAAVRSAAERNPPARQAEGRRLARVLHDDLGQLLTALKINLRLAAASGDLDEARSRAREGVALVDQAIGSVRRLVARLAPPLLDELGLLAALRAFVAGLEADAAEAGQRLTIDLQGAGIEPPRLDTERETAAFQIVEEALTNVVRHARARTARVTLRCRDGKLFIDVRDDGRGFDVTAKLKDREHTGLLGIRERARALGGRCDIRSGASWGTELQVVLPGGGPS